jgi:hypothetical protein
MGISTDLQLIVLCRGSEGSRRRRFNCPSSSPQQARALAQRLPRCCKRTACCIEYPRCIAVPTLQRSTQVATQRIATKQPRITCCAARGNALALRCNARYHVATHHSPRCNATDPRCNSAPCGLCVRTLRAVCAHPAGCVCRDREDPRHVSREGGRQEAQAEAGTARPPQCAA